MKMQKNNGVRGRLRIRNWMVCVGLPLLALVLEARAADALHADAAALGGADLLAVLSDSGGQMVSMGPTLSTVPELIAGLSGMVKADGGKGLKVALKSDGTVWSLTQVGAQLVAAQVPGIDNVVDIATSGNSATHVVALKRDGTVWAWGRGINGQLGNGAKPEFQATPVQVLNLEGIVAIGAGWADTLAVKSNGEVWGCGGWSSNGAPLVAQIPGIDNAIAVSGSAHFLFLKSDNTLMAMGQNEYGQIGDGSTTTRQTPVAVAGLSGVRAVSAGNRHSLALKNDGSVWAWGKNMYGQLGVPPRAPDPNTGRVYEPLPVQAPISDVTAVDGGDEASVVLKSDRTVWFLAGPTQVFYGGNGNRPPTLVSSAWAEAGTVTLPAGTTVHVVASDPDGDALTYAWSQVSGSGAATFAAPAAPDSGVAFSAAGSYTLRVTINDGNGGGVSSDVTVTVLAGGSSGAGDLNGDGIVNITDLLIVVDNWGKTPTDAGYDTRADADGNNLVNIQDLMVVALNFGKDY